MRISLPSVLDPAPQLLIEGSVEGPTAAFLEYVRESPARRMTGGATEAMTSTGRGRLRLRLDLMLKDMARSKIAGEYQFANNSLLLDPRFAPIERASGRIAFTEHSLTIPEIRGQMFGDQVRIAGGSRPDGSVQISAEGRATVEGMRPFFEHPWRRYLSGSSRYAALLTVKDGRAQFTMDSTLEGVASSLPPPLAKNAAEPLPLRMEIFPGDGRDRISLALGPPAGRIVSAELLRAIPQGGASLQVQRALVTLYPGPGEAAKFPERRGLTIRGSLPALDLDRWLPLFDERPAGLAGGEAVSYDVRVGLLDALGKRMRAVSMQGASDAMGWSATMSTAEFAGDLVYRREGDGRLVARFTRLVLPEDSPGVRPGESLKDLPAVDIVADNFVHRGRKLGRFEVLARHEGTVDERNWRIERLAMTNPDSALSGSGLWRQGMSADTALAFKLDVTDVGQFLDRMGFPNHVKGGKANLDGSVKWNGDPLTVDYATLNGQLQLHAEDGQFLEIEPGVGKLVSLMSLQMLPRRLSLDFRDVFSKGFHFDRINGTMGVERGVMDVKKFSIRGPAADIVMTGQVDLSLETQSLAVRVTPQLGDVASTVVGLVNPIAGLATLVAGRMIKNPLGKMFAYDYNISGTWSDPKIEKQQPEAAPQMVEPGAPLR
jgi:uncharacterized protein (TIGR02099 family)